MLSTVLYAYAWLLMRWVSNQLYINEYLKTLLLSFFFFFSVTVLLSWKTVYSISLRAALSFMSVLDALSHLNALMRLSQILWTGSSFLIMNVTIEISFLIKLTAKFLESLIKAFFCIFCHIVSRWSNKQVFKCLLTS